MILKIPQTRYTRGCSIGLQKIDRHGRFNPSVALLFWHNRAVTSLVALCLRRPPAPHDQSDGRFTVQHFEDFA